VYIENANLVYGKLATHYFYYAATIQTVREYRSKPHLCIWYMEKTAMSPTYNKKMDVVVLHYAHTIIYYYSYIYIFLYTHIHKY
jgi:hypothetical protein